MMNKQWQEYSDKYLQLSAREQYLIFITGLVAIFFIILFLFIDAKIIENNKSAKQITRLKSANHTIELSILDAQAALQKDPNEDIRNQIAQNEAKLKKIDNQLLTLTSDLISPVQMRYALLDLLKLEKGVSLLSFELVGAQSLLVNDLPKNSAEEALSATVGAVELSALAEPKLGLNLYRHGIKIKLSGSYFDLRDYLSQIEKLSWKFFWQGFDFKVTTYPNSELEIEMYSLGTKKEFVGV